MLFNLFGTEALITYALLSIVLFLYYNQKLANNKRDHEDILDESD